MGQILFGKNLQEALQMTTIGKKYILVVVGGYDSNIHCYTCLRKEHINENHDVKKAFSYKFSLTGHMNSLKDFAFTSPQFSFKSGLQLLASASQDQNIRLWKIQPLSNV